MTGGTRCQALEIASDLRDYLTREPPLVFDVHSVFRSAVNLLAPDQSLVTLATADRDLMPMGLLFTCNKGALSLQQGQKVPYGEGFFRLPEGTIDCLQAKVRKTSLQAPLLRKGGNQAKALTLIANALAGEDRGGIASLIAFLPHDKQETSGLLLNHYSRFIFHDLSMFLQAFAKGRLDYAGKLAGKLVGFGPGLTPSCDDFLKAFLLSLFYEADFGPDHPQALRFFERIIGLASDRTSLVSCHMLHHAAEGRAGVLELELLAALAGGDLEAIETLVGRTLAFGASSGADFLFGLYCAQRVMPRLVRCPADLKEGAGGMDVSPCLECRVG